MKHTLALCLACFFPFIVMASDLPKVIPGTIEADTADPIVSTFKVEAGLALAFDLTGRYSYIPSWTRDSLVDNDDRTVESVARQIGAQAISFCRTNRLEHLVRSEILLFTGEDYGTKASGIGYAVIRFHNDSTLIADPAILASQQRALCRVLSNNALYAAADSGLNVVSTELAACGGIEFVNDSTIGTPWKVFENRTVVSYDMVQTVIHELQDYPSMTFVDVDTRDAMYAKAGMALVENDRASTLADLRILRQFEVSRIIVGMFRRIAEGAELTLALGTIESNGQFTENAVVSKIVSTDSIEEVRKAVQLCVYDLMP
jgi:hypothetical protein